jgi:hypothetical protein
MWRETLLVLALALVPYGCERENNPVDQYGTGLVDAYKESQAAGEQATLSAIRSAVAVHRATEGKYPESLDAIAAGMGTPLDPDVYAYDPATGSVGLK